MPTKTLKSLEKGIDLLFLFSEERPALSLQEIATALALPASTAYRLLATLQAKHLIARDAASKRYGLDAAVLRLQTAVRARLDVRRLAIPHLEALAALSGETSHLFLLKGREVVCVEAIASPNTIRFMPEKGVGLPLHAPAVGRVVLAHLPEAFFRRYVQETGLRPQTPHTLTGVRALRAVLAEIRRRGFAISFQQMYPGARGVAAPVFDHRGAVIGSLGVSGPDPRFSEQKARRLVPRLQRHAQALSAALGGPSRGGRDGTRV